MIKRTWCWSFETLRRWKPLDLAHQAAATKDAKSETASPGPDPSSSSASSSRDSSGTQSSVLTQVQPRGPPGAVHQLPVCSCFQNYIVATRDELSTIFTFGVCMAWRGTWTKRIRLCLLPSAGRLDVRFHIAFEALRPNCSIDWLWIFSCVCRLAIAVARGPFLCDSHIT